jgi:hypothetical protein
MRQRQADGSITKYTFSRDRQAPGPDEGVYGSRRGSSSSSRGSSSSRVLPDLSGGASSPVPEADPSSSPTSNGFLRRLFVNEEQARPGGWLERGGLTSSTCVLPVHCMCRLPPSKCSCPYK